MQASSLDSSPRVRIKSKFICGSRGGPMYSWGAGYRPSPGLSTACAARNEKGSWLGRCGQVRSPEPAFDWAPGTLCTRKVLGTNLPSPPGLPLLPVVDFSGQRHPACAVCAARCNFALFER